ncbi:hypothetical protein V5O48_007274 [Marasmius crinis-equi]|uniref:Hedgehog/Intein (Hint) domain-containing protein n=1 Tax=Marasmius crinis-equi TaxID=585013 RepID=A0ABR3FHQ5_9AGAR
MILRLTSSDMLNTSLVDIATNQILYTVATIAEPSSPSSSSSITSRGESLDEQEASTDKTIRTTQIFLGNSTLSVPACELHWKGRRPDITIGHEHIGPLAALFDTSSVKLLPKTLAIPTRFDSNYIWAATTTSLTLLDDNTNHVKGTFHQNVLRSSNSFINARIPGVGSNYLEFASHPRASDVEIIVSFFLMDILRRGCFYPTLDPYMFDDSASRPKSPRKRFQETREIIARKLTSRRNTV